MRVYYLSKLLTKILRTDSKAQKEHTSDFSPIGDLEGCTTFRLINFQRIRFLVIALKDGIEMFAWAPKPYHKFMPYKSFHNLNKRPMIVHMTVEEGSRIKVRLIWMFFNLNIRFQILYGTEIGFHAIDTETETRYDLYIPKFVQPPIIPHQIVILPDSDGMELLLCYNDEGVYVNTYGHITKVILKKFLVKEG